MFNAQNRIRQLMAERGWTIYRLAQESGLSQTTISNLSMAQTYYTAAKPYLALEHAEVIKKYLHIK